MTLWKGITVLHQIKWQRVSRCLSIGNIKYSAHYLCGPCSKAWAWRENEWTHLRLYWNLSHRISKMRNMFHLFVLTLTPGCWCDPVGSVTVGSNSEAAWCHPRSGQCPCKPGVGGTSCSHCLPGHWGFGLEGCRPCACPLTCDPVTGNCFERWDLELIFCNSSFLTFFFFWYSWSTFHKIPFLTHIPQWLMHKYHFRKGGLGWPEVCGVFLFF